MLRKLMFATLGLFALTALSACEMVDDGDDLLLYEEELPVVDEGDGPGGFTKMGDYTYFVGYNASAGKELWRTKDNGQEVALVKDINPGSGSSFPSSLAILGNKTRIYFFAYNEASGYQLWTTTGPLTEKVTSFSVGTQFDDIATTTHYAVFGAVTPDGNLQIWKVSGKTVSLVVNLGSACLESYAVGGNILYYVTRDQDGLELWRTDLSLANPIAVEIDDKAFAAATSVSLKSGTLSLSILAHMSQSDVLRFRSHTSTAPTSSTLIKSFTAGSLSILGEMSTYFYVFGSRVESSVLKSGLFRVSSTSATFLKTLPIGSTPVNTVWGTSLYFQSGNDLLKVSGTSVTTVKSSVGAIDSFVLVASPSIYVPPRLVFTTNSGSAMWQTRGASTTTSPLASITGVSMRIANSPASGALQYTDTATTSDIGTYRLLRFSFLSQGLSGITELARFDRYLGDPQ